jgi:hypothetical protein
MVGVAPTVYVFHAPVEATYAPYFDPPYFYQGYRKVVRWRYQVVALGKNVGDLAHVVLEQPFFWGLAVALLLMYRRENRARIGQLWPVWALAAAGVAIYLPVHLEGRYLAAFLAVLVVLLLDGFAGSPRVRVAMVVLLAGFAVGLVKDQSATWKRAATRWNYRENLEWREADALRNVGLAGREVGVIGWGPNLQCDWAFLADERLIGEIANPADEKAFWAMANDERAIVLMNFRQAGADVVITRDRPVGDDADWEQVGGLPLWVYRF